MLLLDSLQCCVFTQVALLNTWNDTSQVATLFIVMQFILQLSKKKLASVWMLLEIFAWQLQ